MTIQPCSQPPTTYSLAKQVLIELGPEHPAPASTQPYDALVGLDCTPSPGFAPRYRFQVAELDPSRISALCVLYFPAATRFAVYGGSGEAAALFDELRRLAEQMGGFEVQRITPTR